MNTTQQSLSEIGDQARKTYDRLIKQQVEPIHQGKFITLEIDNGDYEISDELNDFKAFDRLKERNPRGQFYVRRVGNPSWVAEFKTPRFKAI